MGPKNKEKKGGRNASSPATVPSNAPVVPAEKATQEETSVATTTALEPSLAPPEASQTISNEAKKGPKEAVVAPKAPTPPSPPPETETTTKTTTTKTTTTAKQEEDKLQSDSNNSITSTSPKTVASSSYVDDPGILNLGQKKVDIHVYYYACNIACISTFAMI